MDMKLVTRSMLYAVILAAFLLTVSMSAMAGKPDRPGKGGTPNENSVATTGACLVDDGKAARVCSTKGISNVVLWCGSTWVKHEDFGPGEVYEATVGCVNGQGDPVGGQISMVAVKSGSQKHAKHHPDGYDPDLTGTTSPPPSGSGLFMKPGYCELSSSCASVDDDPVLLNDDTPPGDDGSDGDTPPGDPIEVPPDDPLLY